MDDFFGWSKVENYWISDIQTLSFHYACWRFSDRDLIKPLLLRVENQFQPVLDRKLDVIFCITVFEHLNDPMETAQRFHQSLNEGGLLVFDYIKSDGHGLDTRFSSIEREKVLRYILDRFEVVEGAIHLDKSVNQVIVRKRSGA